MKVMVVTLEASASPCRSMSTRTWNGREKTAPDSASTTVVCPSLESQHVTVSSSMTAPRMASSP